MHSFQRDVPCPACGDLDGCHRWREKVAAGKPPPVYRQRFSEHRDYERKHAASIIAGLPEAPHTGVELGTLLFEILTGPETAAAEALFRLRFQNAEIAVVDGKCIVRLRAAGKQFIIAVGEDK